MEAIDPNIFPRLADSGEESPLKARIKRIPEITYAIATKLFILF